jgi:hypothetical protein
MMRSVSSGAPGQLDGLGAGADGDQQLIYLMNCFYISDR